MTTAECRLHATMLECDGKGVLLIGESGCGKSDLALRLIMSAPPQSQGSSEFKDQSKFNLVADDQVVIRLAGGKLSGEAPETIAGKIEVRHIGICEFPYTKRAPVNLVIDLESSGSIERLPPDNQTYKILGIAVPLIKLAPFEASSPSKLILALKNI